MSSAKSTPQGCSATQSDGHPAKAVVVPSTPMSRWPLILEARLWRAGMRFGMFLHRLAPPRPPRPSFKLTIPTTLSSRPGKVGLVFYTPRGYQRGPSVTQRYPFMVVYHGGGFTLGEPEDDARWAAAVVKHCNMVVVCVGYRRAPEHPFPTAVEDGADAMLWLLDHAAEYSLDADRMGCSGFSAGANLALTSTLRLEDALLRRAGSSSASPTLPHRSAVKLIVSFYPALDYTRCRATRIASCSRPEMTLPAVFTRLFDRSYLHPPRDIAMDSPYLSPGAASNELLGLLPNELALYLCQWDMLLQEGEVFRERMLKLGKNVGGRTIEGVAHGFDRSPNPLRENKVMVEVYAEACANIKRVLGIPSSRGPDDSGSSSKLDILNSSQTDN